MTKNYSPQDVNAHYARRHGLRSGLFGDKPYANYGYWPRDGMNIEEACDAMTDLMAGELRLCETDRLLECGCGYGASAITLAEKFRPSRITGIDVTDVRIQQGTEMIRERKLDDTIRLQVGDATKLDFDDGAFTKLMAIECAFHFNTRADFFKEAWRVLAPGGILAMTDIVPAPHLDLTQCPLEQLREYLSADAKFICDANIYGNDTYEELLRQAGFDNVKITSIKDKVVLQFAEHLERVAATSPPDARDRRLAVARTFRECLMVGGDYVVVHAEKLA